MITEIKKFIQQSNYPSILKQLIQTNTSNPPGDEKKIIDLILSFFPVEQINYKIINHTDSRSSLIITVAGKNTRKSIAFVGHVDTVPVTDGESWVHPPFSGEIDGEYIYGRGASDMKGGITAMILTAQYFIENKIIPPYTVKFCFTADEEAGGLGIQALRDQGDLDDTSEVFICEPSECKIGISEKGALWLKIIVKGKASHAAQPEEGINAVEYLIAYINAFKTLILTGKRNDPLLGPTTVTITQIKGGIKSNIIPEEAYATLDIRTNTDSNHGEIIKKAGELADLFSQQFPGLKINIMVENNRPPVNVDPKASIIRALTKILNDMHLTTELKGMHFYTDASQLVPYKKIPFVILGPGEDSMAHKKNERILLNSIATAAEIYIRYILQREGNSNV
ncbi:M20 family metallopeptidase [Thermosyntropha sp.]|uniref:M20 family metallopeptidase n=1 Tax=Thermosyntropha sp. TaxID=2740820 RepID=UPI0025E52FB8|nr:M20 family metallopeptidase [Thermosyntropha sp.]MBO8158808.1 M20 family metallopeptidase [Thermosyntropha sp.]